MRRYALLYKDEALKVSYFYSLEDKLVYYEQIQMNNTVVQKAASAGGIGGTFLALTYKGEVWIPGKPNVLFVMLFLSGILLGGLFAYVLIRKTSGRVFVRENVVELSKEEIANLYDKGKRSRRKYWLLFLLLLALSVVFTAIFSYVVTNGLLVLCCIIMWGVLAVMLFTVRPICCLRMKQSVKQ